MQLANPANEEYEVVRTTLLPGILKTMHHNRSMPKKNGIKFFEISDVVLKDERTDVGARNERHLVAAYGGLSAGFEVIHGLVDRVMTLNQVARVAAPKGPAPPASGASVYAIVPLEDPEVCETFLPGRRASILASIKGKPFESIGCFGILHPEVISAKKFDLDFPCSAVEMNLEALC